MGQKEQVFEEKSRKQTVDQIEPGMVVEATAADIGEEDLSKPKITGVVKNDAGDVEKVVVKKGVVFSKEIEIPVERVQSVEAADGGHSDGKVVIKAEELEVEALGAVGSETLSPHNTATPPDDIDFMEQIEEAVPTDAGLRQMEQRHSAEDAKQSLTNKTSTNTETKNQNHLLQMLGPGFLGGMSGNDSTAVTSYAVNGAKNGYGQLWLILLSVPLLQAVLFACGKIGRITQKGLGELLTQNYGRKVAIPTAIALIIGNVALIAGDLVAIGSGLELITGISWIWFVVPIAVALWYITVYQNFESIKKIFVVLSLAFVSYLITGLLAGADWGSVLSNTFVPHLDFSFDSISSAVAILGATISPYTMFWQVQGEKEEQRSGTTTNQVKVAALDIFTGVFSGNLIAYFIIVATSATLFAHHSQIATAADAAKALEPLVGSFAKYLFAAGLIGAGLVAIPILLASTSYALSGTFGLPSSLSKKPWQNEGFYLILTVAMVASLVVALIGFDPIQLMFWANVLQAFLAPILITLIFIIGNSRKIMGRYRLSFITNAGLIITGLILVIAAAALVFGLVTGQGGN